MIMVSPIKSYLFLFILILSEVERPNECNWRIVHDVQTLFSYKISEKIQRNEEIYLSDFIPDIYNLLMNAGQKTDLETM